MYKHGIYTFESDTALTVPVRADSAIQVVIGTAPVHLVDSSPVNTPVLAFNFGEAASRVGYSDDYEKFTICQAMDMGFRKYGVAPQIYINVLDPARHNAAGTEVAFSFDLQGRHTLANSMIITDSNFKLTSDEASSDLVLGEDYTLARNSDGTVTINLTAAESGTYTAVYNVVEPSAVTTKDIIDGFAAITDIYPRFNIVPTILLAPGWTHNPAVAMALEAATYKISSVFNAVAICDIDPSVKHDEAGKWKNDNGYVLNNMIACYPKATLAGVDYWKSAVLAAHMAMVDSQNGSLPFESPSNKAARITGIVDGNGDEIILTLEQANLLNGQGIVTALNMGGWRIWGNNMASFPASTDYKNRWIPVRRMMQFLQNTFTLAYFQRVDKPMNPRQIEAVITSENLRLNGLVAVGALHQGARIEFPVDLNPPTALMDGIVTFKTWFTPPAPMEAIVNIFEIDTNAFAGLAG